MLCGKRHKQIFTLRLMQLIALAACVVFAASCTGSDTAYDRVNTLRTQVKQYFVKRNIDSALYCARRLKDASDSADIHPEFVTALVYIGQAHMIQHNVDSMIFYFNRAQELYNGPEDDNAMGIMCNALAIHALYSEINTTKCIGYLLEGMRYASRSHDDTLTTMLKSNLAIAHYVQKDTSGLQYALDTYRRGRKDGNAYITYCGALTSSYLLALKQDYSTAWTLLQEVLPDAALYNDMHGIYTLAGDILINTGDTVRALEYYSLALKYNNEQDRFSGFDIYLSLGLYLKSCGQYAKALDMISRGLDISYRNNNTFNRYLLYKEGAQICSLMNDAQGYARYSALYNAERDSIFSIKNEREKDYYSRSLTQFSQEVRNRAVLWILFSVSLTVLILTIMFIFVRRHRLKEKELIKALEELKNREPEESRLYRNRTDNDKMDRLFTALEELMRTRHPYHDPDLTREKTAVMLNTNRTYITNIIKQYTGLSFYSYINRFRIEEAIHILSDKKNDTPIKAISEDLGFKSLSTFYKMFSAATGQSPASFRNNLLRQEQIASSGKHNS